MPGEDEDELYISKYASESTFQTFSSAGGSSSRSQSNGVFALEEQSQISFSIAIMNNAGQAFSGSGIIALQYAPESSDDSWSWENWSYHTSNYADIYKGEFVQS